MKFSKLRNSLNYYLKQVINQYAVLAHLLIRNIVRKNTNDNKIDLLLREINPWWYFKIWSEIPKIMFRLKKMNSENADEKFLRFCKRTLQGA